MNTLTQKLIALSCCLGALTTGRAQFHVEAGGGVTLTNPIQVREVVSANGSTFPLTQVKFNPGPMVYINPGWDFGRWRFSGNLDVSDNEVYSVRAAGNAVGVKGKGDLYVFNGVPTIGYQILDLRHWTWNISGGVGIAAVFSDKLGAKGGTDLSNSSDFAYVIKGGSSIGYKLSEKFSLMAGFTYARVNTIILHTTVHTSLHIRDIEQTQFYLGCAYKW